MKIRSQDLADVVFGVTFTLAAVACLLTGHRDAAAVFGVLAFWVWIAA